MIGAFKIVFWHWWTLAGILFILEMTLPGVAFLFMAVGAAVAGLVLLVVPDLMLELQLLIFAVIAVVAAVGMRKLLPDRYVGRKGSQLNDRGGVLVGRELVLSEPIVNGQGRVKVGDTSWPVSGPDMAAGFRVTVVSIDGAQLKVQPSQ
jgi:membrane protein implicated in regulation of membrane protease activity